MSNFYKAVSRRDSMAFFGALGALGAAGCGNVAVKNGNSGFMPSGGEAAAATSAPATGSSFASLADALPGAGGVFDATKYGAKGDGLANDSVAIQNAINAAQLVGGTVFLPPGSYKITSPLRVSGKISIVGSGIEGEQGKIYKNQIVTASSGFKGSVLVVPGSISALIIQTNIAISLSGFQITYPTRPADTTSAIVIQSAIGPGNANTGSVIRDIMITGHGIGISLIDTLDFVIDNAKLNLGWFGGISLSTPNYPKWGDSTITNCTISGAGIPTHSYHILITSGGGLRVINNKMNYGGANTSAIMIAPNLAEVNVEPLLIANNSIEGCAIGINFSAYHVAGETSAIVITGNQIWTGVCAIYANTYSSVWITGICITSNMLMTLGETTQPIIVLDSAQIGVISGNTFTLSGNGTGAGAVLLGSHSSQINVQSNAYSHPALTVRSLGQGNKLGGGVDAHQELARFDLAAQSTHFTAL